MTETRRRWDPVVRIVHWSVAAMVLVNLFVNDPEGSAHEWIGYIVASLVALRLLWGMSFARGPNHLRDFLPRRSGIAAHIAEIKQGQYPQLGHNPLGTLAIYTMWICLFLLTFSGWGLYYTDWDEPLEVLHEVLAHAMQLMVLLHIIAVLWVSRKVRHNLIKPMIDGKPLN